jgi:hypothetical protein
VNVRSDVLRYLEPAPWDCFSGGRAPLSTLGVSKEGTAIAMLVASEYELRDCAGTVLAQGGLLSEGQRLILLKGTTLFSSDAFPIAVPTIGDVASIIVDLLTDSFGAEAQVPVKAHGLRQESDIDLDLTPGSTCL